MTPQLPELTYTDHILNEPKIKMTDYNNYNSIVDSEKYPVEEADPYMPMHTERSGFKMNQTGLLSFNKYKKAIKPHCQDFNQTQTFEGMARDRVSFGM